MTDFTAEEKIERGHQARSITESTIYKEAVAGLEAKYIEAWKSAITVEAREDAHKYIRLLEWLQNDIKSIATTGQIAKARLDELRGSSPYGKITEFNR